MRGYKTNPQRSLLEASRHSVIITAALLVGAGGASADTFHVNITSGSGFSPQTTEIWAGDTVEWDWVSGTHSTTSNTGVWDSALHGTGNPKYTYSYTFNPPGAYPIVYPYKCLGHYQETGSVTVKSKWPVGFYSLTKDSSKVIVKDLPDRDLLLDRSYVSGFRLRLDIRDIQPDTGNPYTDSTTYDWHYIDDAIAAVKSGTPTGKRLGLSIAWGRFCPNWLFDANAAHGAAYKFPIDVADNGLVGANAYIPLPWDPVYQQYLYAFIDALAAKYDRDDTIQYIAITGFQQLVENRLINIDDASVRVTGATLTKVGTTCQVDSSTAHFLTRAGSSTIVGKVIASAVANDLPPNAQVLASPAPTDTRVYLNKLAKMGVTTADVDVLQWLPGLGDQKNVNDYAISLLYNDYTPAGNDLSFYCRQWANSTPLSGFACVRAYIPAVEAIFAYWVQKFPHTPLILTAQSPFSDGTPATWNTNLTSILKQYLNQSPLGGYMTASLYSVCEDGTLPAQAQTPKGDQMIHALNRDDVYQGSKCADGSNPPAFYTAERVHDACEAALLHGDTWLEPYYPDLLADGYTGMQTQWATELPRFAAPTPAPSATPTPCP